MTKIIRINIPGYPRSIIAKSGYVRERSVEVFGLSQYEKLLKEYIGSHKEDILRRIDVLVLYIDSFRKIFEKNIGLVNKDIIPHILSVSSKSAVKEKGSYMKNYLYCLKDGFKKAANNIIAVYQQDILLEEIDLDEYDRHIEDGEFQQVSDALLKTAADASAIGRAFGQSYITSSWDDHKDYKIKRTEYFNAGNNKDRYLVDIHFYDGIGYAELSIISFFKIGG
jgi:hypothetical protein